MQFLSRRGDADELRSMQYMQSCSMHSSAAHQLSSAHQLISAYCTTAIHCYILHTTVYTALWRAMGRGVRILFNASRVDIADSQYSRKMGPRGSPRVERCSKYMSQRLNREFPDVSHIKGTCNSWWNPNTVTEYQQGVLHELMSMLYTVVYTVVQ